MAIVKEAAQGPPGRYLHDPYARQQISHYLLVRGRLDSVIAKSINLSIQRLHTRPWFPARQLDSVVAWLEHYGRIERA